MRKPEKLSEHIFRLLEYLRDEGDMDLVYAIDDEGNAFHKVYHHPTLGMYNEKRGEYLSMTEYEQSQEEDELYYPGDSPDDTVKVVCIN